ncbi:MAG: TRAP transporter large permease [Deltaproteobacteria bacterium]|nr:TRAP transporter large permease [Deltaproteobacteria bacterium]
MFSFAAILIGCLLVGLPIFIALIIPSMGILNFSLDMPAWIVPQRVLAGMNKYTLLCVPFFVLAANVMAEGEIGRRLIGLARCLVGHVYGGMALTGILACTIVGAISGAGAAGIMTVGPLMVKELEQDGYNKRFAVGLITSISDVAMLIPPSIIFIIYALVTNQSIAKLFLAGMGGGLVFASVFVVYSYVYARRHKVALRDRASLRELGASIKESSWALGLPVIILGGIYSGIFSPTEAAGAAAVYAIVIEMVVYKTLNLKGLFNISVKTAGNVAMIYVLLGAGLLLAYAMTLSKLPLVVLQFLGGTSPLAFLVVVNLAFLAIGCFVGPGSAIVILMPLFMPTAQALGVDPMHLAVVVVTNLAIGMDTPPFGIDLFVSSGVLKVEYSFVVRAIVPFMIANFTALIIITLFPFISTWLPSLIMG